MAAFSEYDIRIWTASFHLQTTGKGRVLGIRDGFGNTTSAKICHTAEYRIMGWYGLGKVIQKMSISLDNGMIRAASLPDISTLRLDIRRWNIENDLLILQVTARDGVNKGYTFSGVGQVQNTNATSNYGGVAYGYSNNTLQLLLPTGDGAWAVQVGSVWGSGAVTQTTNNVTITATILGSSVEAPPSCQQARYGAFSGSSQATRCDNKSHSSCARQCFHDTDCIGFIPCQNGTNPCYLVSTNEANAAIIDGFDDSHVIWMERYHC